MEINENRTAIIDSYVEKEKYQKVKVNVGGVSHVFEWAGNTCKKNSLSFISISL
jgi:hypothetical protein